MDLAGRVEFTLNNVFFRKVGLNWQIIAEATAADLVEKLGHQFSMSVWTYSLTHSLQTPRPSGWFQQWNCGDHVEK